MSDFLVASKKLGVSLYLDIQVRKTSLFDGYKKIFCDRVLASCRVLSSSLLWTTMILIAKLCASILVTLSCVPKTMSLPGEFFVIISIGSTP